MAVNLDQFNRQSWLRSVVAGFTVSNGSASFLFPFSRVPPGPWGEKILSPTSHRLIRRVVRMGFIIGLSGDYRRAASPVFAAYRVHEQELNHRRNALARASTSSA